MKCEYCGDPILKFQEKIKRYNPRRGKTEYHKGCYEIILDKFIDKVKKI
ncbi:hypothetical protein ES702_06367 [subsurface metagenome]